MNLDTTGRYHTFHISDPAEWLYPRLSQILTRTVRLRLGIGAAPSNHSRAVQVGHCPVSRWFGKTLSRLIGSYQDEYRGHNVQERYDHEDGANLDDCRVVPGPHSPKSENLATNGPDNCHDHPY